MSLITIVDYGMGNLGSVSNMFKRIGVSCKVSSDLNEIGAAEKILLPGVGSFDTAMNRINDLGLRPILDKKALVDKIPFLGICLGMQLLTRGSEEGKLPGLGWINADTLRFPDISGLKVPHMGWNLVNRSTESSLTGNLQEESRFYFVHSYYVRVDSDTNSILKANYGVQFDAGIQKDNIFGTQFHPEKSHRYGMELLASFSKI